MTSQRKGGWRTIAKRRYMRVRVGADQRTSVALTGCGTDDEATARCEAIASVVDDLVAAGRPDRVREFAIEIGAATSAKRIETIRKAVAHVVATASAAPRSVTVRDWAGRWTSGELARQHPDHVRAKDHADDIGCLKNHILPVVGDVPVVRFGLEDGERVMARIPAGRSVGTRRQIAQVMHRLLAIAVYPGKLIAANPLPKGFMPSTGKAKAKPYLFPDEFATLMACRKIPLERRLVYGFLASEGPRAGELVGNVRKAKPPMSWGNIDLARGIIRLDTNKTDQPRTWAMNPGVLRALTMWMARNYGAAAPGYADPVVNLPLMTLAAQFRADMVTAFGDKLRPELLERSSSRARLVAHHLRATFITLSLASGRTETWVMDRTGHRSSIMINRYRQAARTAAELGLGELLPLDEAIPEFRTKGPSASEKRQMGQGGAKVGKKSARSGTKAKGLR